MIKLQIVRNAFLVGACIAFHSSSCLASAFPCESDTVSISDSEGYPAGTEKVANLPCRVGCWTGFNGMAFEYRVRDTTEFNEALEIFSKIHTATLDLELCDGPKDSLFKFNQTIDWTFMVYLPEFHHHDILRDRKILGTKHPDTMVIRAYLGGEVKSETRSGSVNRAGKWVSFDIHSKFGPGHIKLEELEIPPNVTIIDKRTPSPPPPSHWNVPNQ